MLKFSCECEDFCKTLKPCQECKEIIETKFIQEDEEIETLFRNATPASKAIN